MSGTALRDATSEATCTHYVSDEAGPFMPASMVCEDCAEASHEALTAALRASVARLESALAEARRERDEATTARDGYRSSWLSEETRRMVAEAERDEALSDQARDDKLTERWRDAT